MHGTVFTATFAVLIAAVSARSQNPRVLLSAGVYEGVRDPTFGQDYFLGIPYAQPPIGPLRFQNPEPLNVSWNGIKTAKAYSASCVGYLGLPPPSEQSEDCLTVNVIRPSYVHPQEKLPVLVWIHGGGYIFGSSSFQAYNLSNIVAVSQRHSTPIIAVSLNYRLSGFGFLASQEIIDHGSANLGMKDQRLALQWIQENIAAFGGDKNRVTIWGQSSGGFSVGLHMVGWNASSEGLFRSSICQSGSVFLDGSYKSLDFYRPHYEALLLNTGCANTSDTLSCLRNLPFQKLNETFSSQADVWAMPVIDGVVMHDLPSKRLAAGAFAKVPLIVGTTSDEASPYVLGLGIETEEDFRQFISTPDGVGVTLSNETISHLASAYPNDLPSQLPKSYTLPSPAPEPLYSHYKRVVTYHSDRTQIGPRRWTCNTWADNHLPVYCYRFDTKPFPSEQFLGVAHADDLPWVFSNLEGRGYDVNPFQDAPQRYFDLAEEMSRRWVSFAHDGSPQVDGLPTWPVYGKHSLALVFAGNATISWVEKDVFRKDGIDMLWRTRGELLV